MIGFNSKTILIGFTEFTVISRVLSVPHKCDDKDHQEFLQFILEVCLKNIKGDMTKQGTNRLFSTLLLQRIVLAYSEKLTQESLDEIFEAGVLLMNSEVSLRGYTEVGFGLMCSCILFMNGNLEVVKARVEIFLPRIFNPKTSVMFRVRTLCLISAALLKLSEHKITYYQVAVGVLYMAFKKCLAINDWEKERAQVEIAIWCQKRLPKEEGVNLQTKAAIHEQIIAEEEDMSDEDYNYRDYSHLMMRKTCRGSEKTGNVEQEISESLAMIENTDPYVIDGIEMLKKKSVEMNLHSPTTSDELFHDVSFLKEVLFLKVMKLEGVGYILRKIYTIRRLAY